MNRNLKEVSLEWASTYGDINCLTRLGRSFTHLFDRESFLSTWNLCTLTVYGLDPVWGSAPWPTGSMLEQASSGAPPGQDETRTTATHVIIRYFVLFIFSLRVKILRFREVCRKSKWKFKMAFAMKGGESRGGLACHIPILKNGFY